MNPDTFGRASDDIIDGSLRDGHLQELRLVHRALVALAVSSQKVVQSQNWRLAFES